LSRGRVILSEIYEEKDRYMGKYVIIWNKTNYFEKFYNFTRKVGYIEKRNDYYDVLFFHHPYQPILWRGTHCVSSGIL
jgi:hypothetical protein